MTQRPDQATAQDKGGDFDPHSEGQHGVLCVDVVNLGPKIEQFAEFPAREVEKVALIFASGERNDDGSLRIITVEVTNSMGEKANLRKLLESWRGKSYNDEQAKAGVPLHRLHGQAGLVTVEHITTRRNRTFAKLVSLTPLPKAMPAPDPKVLEKYERPEFLEKKKEEYAQAVAKFRAAARGIKENADAAPDPEYPGDDPDDDLPF